MTSRASDPFPPLANSDFSGHGFLLFRWLVFTNSVSRTPSRPTGCQIKYGGYQFADCQYVHFSVHRYEKNPGFSAVNVRTRKKPEKPPPPYLILHSVCILSLFQRSRFQRGQINDPGKIAAWGRRPRPVCNSTVNRAKPLRRSVGRRVDVACGHPASLVADAVALRAAE